MGKKSTNLKNLFVLTSILFLYVLTNLISLPAFKSEHLLIDRAHAEVEEMDLFPTYPDGFSPNTSTLHPQWNHNVMNIGEAWADGYTGAGVKIAILDTGFFHRHPDISLAGGYSVFPDDPWSNDHSGHGTHIAGIIAANRGTPYQGIAPDAEVYGIKIYHSNDVNEEGEVSTDVNSVIKGIRQAIQMEADIIVISSGLSYHDEELYKIIREAYENEILIIAASGNGSVSVNYPARYDEVIAVTAVDERLHPALDIIYGQENDFSAPGVNIGGLSIPDSAYSYPYIFMSGSSQATPHAAGLAAILMQKHGVRGQELRKIMQQTAINIGDSGLYGYGLLYYQSSAEGQVNQDELEDIEDALDENDLASVNSETPNEDESDVRKPASSREADTDTDEEVDHWEVAVTPGEDDLGEIVGNAFMQVQPGGTIELQMDTHDSVRLTQEQVFEIRNNNLTLLLSKGNVSWKIPPSNFVPGQAVLRFYDGRPVGIEAKPNSYAIEQTISIFQADTRREVYPGWMEVHFDLSEVEENERPKLKGYFYDRTIQEWEPSDSQVKDDIFTIYTRHTGVVGFYNLMYVAESENDKAGAQSSLGSNFYVQLAMGVGLFIALLIGVRVYLKKDRRSR